MDSFEQEQFYQLAFYSLSHTGKEFIHQYVVDAFTAQTATADTKPIALYFALAGLYLHVEKKHTGKQVQQAHIMFSETTKSFLRFKIPEFRGAITISHVLKSNPGAERDTLIDDWCKCVWNAYRSEHEKIILFTEGLLQ